MGAPAQIFLIKKQSDRAFFTLGKILGEGVNRTQVALDFGPHVSPYSGSAFTP
jgi:hypothetical protein